MGHHRHGVVTIGWMHVVGTIEALKSKCERKGKSKHKSKIESKGNWLSLLVLLVLPLVLSLLPTLVPKGIDASTVSWICGSHSPKDFQWRGFLIMMTQPPSGFTPVATPHM